MSVKNSTREILEAASTALRAAFGERMRGVILYGSEARGDASSDSDVDLLVVLAGPVSLLEDIRIAVRALYQLSLAIGRPISPKPVDVEAYESARYPLYARARAEGIAA